jgi:Arc/MetJ-type ribon-helix-helix transcriptional regulator
MCTPIARQATTACSRGENGGSGLICACGGHLTAQRLSGLLSIARRSLLSRLLPASPAGCMPLTVSMTYGMTPVMSVAKITISIDEQVLHRVDRLVQSRVFPNRSQAIQAAVQEKLARLEKTRLAQECAKLDPAFEQALADEGLATEIAEWPEY